MSSTILEQLRHAHEDIELYERFIVNTLDNKPKHHRGRINQGHAVSNLLNRVVERSENALELYEDEDGFFEEELDSMSGNSIFTSFYDRLKEIRDYHRKYPNMPVVHVPNVEEELNPSLKFSGEERYGKYVDLHEFYSKFLNISCCRPLIKKHETKKNDDKEDEDYDDYDDRRRDSRSSRSRSSRSKSSRSNKSSTSKTMVYIEYIKYLEIINRFEKIPQQGKMFSSSYHAYLKDLLDYLLEFYQRTQPLVDLDEVMDECRSKFEKDWALNEVNGWNLRDKGVIRDSIKFCKKCDEYFERSHDYERHYKELHVNDTSFEEISSLPMEEMSIVAYMEIRIKKMCELLTEVLDATKMYVENKQTRTPEELQAEIEEEEEGALADVDVHEEEEEDDAPFYNPLNLPLGWDGKPIPYWLYKLHGLGIEFKCEICGNHSYWGRRAFDRHFQEWRHAHGMRCLKIPNTKHFHDITLIEDAINLYERIKDQLTSETWQPGDGEEFEDSEGNVLNKKTYDDLARQGLL